jgi:hypothetical protein
VVRAEYSGALAKIHAIRSGADMRQHHEGLAATSVILPALSLLLPFAGALWLRIKTGKKKTGD